MGKGVCGVCIFSHACGLIRKTRGKHRDTRETFIAAGPLGWLGGGGPDSMGTKKFKYLTPRGWVASQGQGALRQLYNKTSNKNSPLLGGHP